MGAEFSGIAGVDGVAARFKSLIEVRNNVTIGFSSTRFFKLLALNRWPNVRAGETLAVACAENARFAY
jgi:hypothetical protein